MQQTDNLDLELYEATDNANLLDGYNASMRKLDQRDGEVSTLITGLNAAVTLAQADATQALADAATADGKAVAAQADATQALTDAATADGKAVAAQADATQALTELDGMKLHHIRKADTTEWSITSPTYMDTTDRYDIDLMVVETNTGRGLLIGRFACKSTNTVTVSNTQYPCIRLTNWTRPSDEGATITTFLPAFTSQVHANTETSLYQNDDVIGLNFLGTYSGTDYWQGTIITEVVRKS